MGKQATPGVVMVVCIFLSGVAAARGDNLVVAFTGGHAPDGNGSYRTFTDPVLNDQGQSAFKAELFGTSQGSLDDTAIFRAGGAGTAVICHERRYPELVRLAVMAGARILFHPNAGLDSPAVSRRKRGGRDGIVARAFENAIYYVFANSVGPQGGGKWSAGDSKIVAPDERVVALADNRSEAVVTANLDLAKATGVYARRGLSSPRFLASHWKRMVDAVRSQAATFSLAYDLPSGANAEGAWRGRDGTTRPQP